MVNKQTKDFIFERRVCDYKNRSKNFVLSGRSFERQYASFYNVRLSLLKKVLEKKAIKKWGEKASIKGLCDISAGERVVVIGTLTKSMELRPSILKEISEEHHLIAEPVTEGFTSENDFLVLEDELQRITLKGSIDPHAYVTGVIVAILGSEDDDGKFFVEDVCHSSMPDPGPMPSLEKDVCILLVSGLGLGVADVLFPIQLLIDYVTGQLGDSSDYKKASSIARVIIAGNSLSHTLKDKEFSKKAKYLTRKMKASTVDGMKLLDEFIAQLVASVDVDIMPGEFDPANHLLPQQPLHPCMFPKSGGYSTFHTVSNPYQAEIAGLRILGTSGQNINDIVAYSRMSDPLTVMEKTLTWGHISPTAPDTLNCYPFFDSDPFIMAECPHIYFAGNMSRFGCQTFGTKNLVTVISLPKFYNTLTAVIVNLRTMDVEPITFSGFDV